LGRYGTVLKDEVLKPYADYRGRAPTAIQVVSLRDKVQMCRKERGVFAGTKGVMECGGKADAATPLSGGREAGEGGVALRFPPQSKRRT
jgi:hypothetical protein